MSVLRCFDSVTTQALPATPLVLAYVDGDYRNWDEVNARFRGTSTRVVSVTVFGQPGAHVIDTEPGNIDPEGAALWAIDELHHGRRPTVYAGHDWRDLVVTALRSRRVNADTCDYWLADYVQVAPPLSEVRYPRSVPTSFSAWQFADSIPVGGWTVDASIVNVNWARARGLARRPAVTVTTSRRPRC